MKIRPLRKSDDRSTFHSGDPDLDRFFHKYAGQNQFRLHMGTSYVGLDDSERIMGFVTVVAGHIEIENLPLNQRKGFPRYPLPILRLARLAVDTECRGKGVGKSLLKFVFQLALVMSENYGCTAIVVDAKPAALDFYKGFGFAPLPLLEGEAASRPVPLPMFLPIKTIEALMTPLKRG